MDADSNQDNSDNNVVTYNILSGNDDGKFHLEHDTGIKKNSDKVYFDVNLMTKTVTLLHVCFCILETVYSCRIPLKCNCIVWPCNDCAIMYLACMSSLCYFCCIKCAVCDVRSKRRRSVKLTTRRKYRRWRRRTYRRHKKIPTHSVAASCPSPRSCVVSQPTRMRHRAWNQTDGHRVTRRRVCAAAMTSLDTEQVLPYSYL